MNFRSLLSFFVLSFFVACSQTSKVDKTETSSSPKEKRVLFVVTSQAEIPKTGKSTGAYIGEITHPYEVLTKAGYRIDFISPKGGETPLDGMDNLDEISKKFLQDNEFLKKIQMTKRPSDVDPKNYSAIFFAGGHGTMFDLPNNKKLQELTAKIYESGGVVSAVCHGPAGLVNVKLSDGSYLVSGKEISAFTNDEEAAVKLTEAMPFLLEDKLKERGAKHTKADNFKRHVVVSERVITGQNPASAKGVGEAILKELKN
jgi:putative intracellular protease/amidase